MMRYFTLVVLILLIILDSCSIVCKDEKGTLTRLQDFTPRSVENRFINVWTPPCYETETGKKYPVLYMHDGQNLFSKETAYAGEEWEVDETVTRLIREGKIPACIVVGIWNTSLRFTEYAPYKPYLLMKEETRKSLKDEFRFESEPLSDEYITFIVHELKPYMDRNFRTLPGREHTFIAGSSMGGLISLYAISEYPRIFGGAACLSTHWPFRLKENSNEFTHAFVSYLEPRLNNLKGSKLYFDYGTATLDAWYEEHQVIIDSLFTTNGFDTRNFSSRKFEGHEHSEKSWRQRFDQPLIFLLGF